MTFNINVFLSLMISFSYHSGFHFFLKNVKREGECFFVTDLTMDNLMLKSDLRENIRKQMDFGLVLGKRGGVLTTLEALGEAPLWSRFFTMFRCPMKDAT